MFRKNNLGNEVTATVSWTFNFEILDNTVSQDFCVIQSNFAIATSFSQFISIFILLKIKQSLARWVALAGSHQGYL